ncbi:hypothetical protein F511_05874 [Dorcoceras hygrometricum]|uniref:Uncharacterized protein n=1 Tax=Dorcoceras hygrometricum TaxID=472368 RepID=A0A2Z7BAS9_9LAMI|nr:hypothetical protein F511_05874 [Dorcoceras hygrometricum]
MRIRPSEFETSICDAKYHVSLLLSVLGFNPEVLWGCCVCLPVCCSVFPGYSAGRGFDPAGGVPGGG